MSVNEFINMSKRMVVEYYNRYIHMVDYPVISLTDVTIIEFSNSSDKIQEALLKVDIDPWIQYTVIYNPNRKNKKDQTEIISYITYV